MSEEKQIRETLARNERLYQEVVSIREELRRHIRNEVRGLATRTHYKIGDLVATSSQSDEEHSVYGSYRGDAWKNKS